MGSASSYSRHSHSPTEVKDSVPSPVTLSFALYKQPISHSPLCSAIKQCSQMKQTEFNRMKQIIFIPTMRTLANPSSAAPAREPLVVPLLVFL